MRILVLTNYYSPIELGGWEQLTFNVVQELKQRGHAVRVLTSNFRVETVTWDEPDVERTLHLESPDHLRYRLAYTLHRRAWEQQNRQVLQQTVDEFKPQVIYINGMWNLPVSIAQEAERLLPGKVVYYLASYWPAELDAHRLFWNDRAGNPIKRLPKRIAAFFVNKLWMDQSPRDQLEFRRVLCVSDFVRQQLIGQGKLRAEQSFVVHNGIEVEQFKNAQRSPSGSSINLVYAGRLARDKGVHTVIEALDCLRAHKLPATPKLSIAGTGSPDYEAYLRQEVQRRGLEGQVSFLGSIPRADMPALLSSQQILVFPSIWDEPLARIVQEAMACELLVIGTNTGGTPEILWDGQTGMVFTPENAAELAEKIAWAAQNPEALKSMARKARQTVVERFSMTRMVTEVEAHLQQAGGMD